MKKTKYDMSVFFKFLREVGETREVKNIPSSQLDKFLCNFYISVRRKDKNEYEPDTLFSFSRSIQRYLDESESQMNILKDDEFKTSSEALKAKRRELRKQGKGNHPNATEALYNEDIDIIFAKDQFGCHDNEVLSRTMWFLITLHCGHRARHEARQLRFGGIQLKKMKPPKRSTLNGLQIGTQKPAMAMSTSKTGLFSQKPSAQLVMRSVQCLVTAGKKAK